MSRNLGGDKIPPCFFDYALYLFTFLCPVFFLPDWDLNMIRGLFFTFGVFGLLALSFVCERQRNIKNIYLPLIILWSLVMIFIHSFDFSFTKSYVQNFLNFCLMSEGFIYILCGCILYYLVVNYSKKFDIFYPILLINILNFILCIMQALGYKFIWVRNVSVVSGFMGFAPHLVIFSALSIPILFYRSKYFSIIPLINTILGHLYWNSFAGVLALFIAVSLYLIHYKRYKKLILWFIPFSILLVRWDMVMNKLLLRIDLWMATILEIVRHPLSGYGFDNSLTFNMINVGRGWMYRHNDYLNIAKDLGLPFLVFTILTVRNIFKNAKVDYLWIAVVILMISSFVWTSMYFVSLGSLGIVLLAVMERNKYESWQLPKM